MSHVFDLKEQYHQLTEYLSTLTWMHYEKAKKRGQEYKGYLYFFGRTLHRVLHPLYFYHQIEDPQFARACQSFDPKNPEERFASWPEKKAYLVSKFREKKLEIYSPEFTRNLLRKYNYQVFQWLVRNNLPKILEFDSCLEFYSDIASWPESYFLEFLGERQDCQSDYLQANKSCLSLASLIVS